MAGWKTWAGALGCAGLISSTILAASGIAGQADDPFDPAALAAALCRTSGTAAGAPALIRLAAASTETRPFAAPDQPADALAPAGEAELYGNLGTLTYPISTSVPEAQAWFDQGLRLAYAFNHAEALRAFRKAEALDPGCAMCAWGQALVLGPNINAPMDPAANAPAYAAAARAVRLAAAARPNERALIQAIAARYAEVAAADRSGLDRAYAGAMEKAAQAFPEDPQINTLFAEALMDLQPWDYWEAGGAKAKGRGADIVTTLERVLASNPDHPGAIHYYIHAVEASNRPERAEPYADRLGGLMAGAGHLVHMPSHIYYRVGRYLESLEANRKAVEVDESYFGRSAAGGLYRQGYYPHNIHFLMVSAQMSGDGPTAIEAASKLAAAVSDEAARAVPWVQPIKAAPYFTHAQFSAPGTVLGLAAPSDALPYVRAMWHYARGVALARQGRAADAAAEATAIGRLAKDSDFADLIAAGVPAPDVLALAAHVVQARIAEHSGDLAAARSQLEQAIALEDRLPYMEPPFWYYPVRQTLGAVLLRQGELAQAEQAFRDSLIRTPQNGWALFGLMQVHEARGDKATAAETARLFGRAWAGDRTSLALALL